jgi:hypothetical protein
MNYAEFDAAWSRLPPIPSDNLHGRWGGPLVDAGLEQHLSDLSEAAYGYLEHCQWLPAIRQAPAFAVEGRRVDADWVAAITEAAQLLAEAGSISGPESSEEKWLSWLCWELAGPHEWLTEVLEGDEDDR